ncbi:hypothetical protein LPUS_02805 [Lasallia pustulata]|uniref:Uncharacterized protein n=1 Tax=Lasallia pustulata TaxID=136370 RepID=A0A1W5CTX6_9LECA|nr:hypothetical protein LPUS_02805 [Lasallia pustulata]
MSKPLASTSASSSKAAALETTGGMSDIPTDDPVPAFGSGSQVTISTVGGANSLEQSASTVSEYPVADDVLPATAAAASVSPEIVNPVPLPDPFTSRSSHAVDAAPAKPASRQNALSKTSGLLILRYRKENTHAPATVERPRPVIQSLDDTISKRKRVESQAEVSKIPPPKRNRTLWSTPAYDPSKDPAMKVAVKTEPTTVISAALTAAPMTAAPMTATNKVAKLPRTVRSMVDSNNNREGTSKASAAPKTTPAKSKVPRTEKSNVPCNPSNTQSSPSNIPNHTPVAPSPTLASPPTILPAPSTTLTPTASNTKVSKPWTSREYAELATLAFHSFPFAAFAATHSKTEAEVFNTFSAIIQLPIFKHSANGLARAKLARERVRAFKNGLKEVKERHKAEGKEARKNAGPANSKKRDVVWKPEEDRLEWPFGN